MRCLFVVVNIWQDVETKETSLAIALKELAEVKLRVEAATDKLSHARDHLAKRKQEVAETVQKKREDIQTTKDNNESLLEYQKQLGVDMDQAERSRNHNGITKILQCGHLHQMPALQSKGIAAIQNLLCTSKPEELATIAGDVSSVAMDMKQRKWAAHAPINDSQKKDILVTSGWVVDVANVIKTAQEAHKSVIGATLNTNFREVMERTLQTVVVDTKPVSAGHGCVVHLPLTK